MCLISNDLKRACTILRVKHDFIAFIRREGACIYRSHKFPRDFAHESLGRRRGEDARSRRFILSRYKKGNVQVSSRSCFSMLIQHILCFHARSLLEDQYRTKHEVCRLLVLRLWWRCSCGGSADLVGFFRWPADQNELQKESDWRKIYGWLCGLIVHVRVTLKIAAVDNSHRGFEKLLVSEVL